MSHLSDRTSIRCSPDTPKLSSGEIATLLPQLDQGWDVVGEHHLRRQFSFRQFTDGLAFVNRIAAVAEQENHHPDIELSWGSVVVSIHTHAIDGLSENDFILAARIDPLYQQPSS